MLMPEKPNKKAEAHWARPFELMDTDVFNGEDLVVCEQIQRGLSSGANDRLILGQFEQVSWEPGGGYGANLSS